MAGQGLAGIGAGVLQMTFMATLPDSFQTAATIYFMVAAAITFACIVTYALMIRMPFTKHHMARGDTAKTAPAEERMELGDEATEAEDAGLISGQQQQGVLSIFRQYVGYEAVAVCNVFVMTFLVFPGVVGKIPFRSNPVSSMHLTGDWWFTILIFLFNVFDTVGRYIPGVVPIVKGRFLLVLTVLRYGLVPMLVGAALNWSPAFFNDLEVAMTIVFLAISNGYLASSAMISGPSNAPAALKEKAGFIMTLALQAGILIGSQGAFGVSGKPATSC
jgi:equilibrative nucleoside transporter 1/2/3